MIICTVFFILTLRHSLREIARMIGIGKPAIRPYRLSVTVFHISLGKFWVLTNISKYLYQGSAHWLPRMPLVATKSLKAIRMPYIGL